MVNIFIGDENKIYECKYYVRTTKDAAWITESIICTLENFVQENNIYLILLYFCDEKNSLSECRERIENDVNSCLHKKKKEHDTILKFLFECADNTCS